MESLRFKLTHDRTRHLVWRGDVLVRTMPVFAGGEQREGESSGSSGGVDGGGAGGTHQGDGSDSDNGGASGGAASGADGGSGRAASGGERAGAGTDEASSDEGDDDDKGISAKEARRLRKENQRRREENEQLKQSFDSLKSTIAKGLGLEKTDDDPETLKKSVDDVTKERDDARTSVRTLTLQRAVDAAARKEDASEGLTWAFLNSHDKLTNIDIASDGYEDEVAKIVQSAIKAEPNLKVSQRQLSSGPDFRGGRTPEGQPKNLEEAVAAHYAGD